MIKGPCAEQMLEAVEVRAGKSALKLETVEEMGILVARATFDEEGEEVEFYKHYGIGGIEPGSLEEFWSEEWPPVRLS